MSSFLVSIFHLSATSPILHSEYALLANVIVAAEGATFHDIPHFAGGIVPGDGIFTTWSYRAVAGRAEAFLLNPQPLTARAPRTNGEWLPS